jgi:hypothetical protein
MRVYYSADTRSNFMCTCTSGDHHNGLLVPTGNELNGEANKLTKDSIWISVCSVSNFKPAYCLIKSNLVMLTSGDLKETLQNISEKLLTRTSKLLFTHKYDFNIKNSNFKIRPISISKSNPKAHFSYSIGLELYEILK